MTRVMWRGRCGLTRGQNPRPKPVFGPFFNLNWEQYKEEIMKWRPRGGVDPQLQYTIYRVGIRVVTSELSIPQDILRCLSPQSTQA